MRKSTRWRTTFLTTISLDTQPINDASVLDDLPMIPGGHKNIQNATQRRRRRGRRDEQASAWGAWVSDDQARSCTGQAAKHNILWRAGHRPVLRSSPFPAQTWHRRLHQYRSIACLYLPSLIMQPGETKLGRQCETLGMESWAPLGGAINLQASIDANEQWRERAGVP